MENTRNVSKSFRKGERVASGQVFGTVIAVYGIDYIGTLIAFNSPSEDCYILVQWDGACLVWENPNDILR